MEEKGRKAIDRKGGKQFDKDRTGGTCENALSLQALVQTLRGIAGEKLAAQSRRREDRRRGRCGKVPRVAMDYFPISKADETASQNLLMVMTDEESGSRSARAVAQKGLGDGQEMSWLVEDMCNQLSTWGHAGGAGGGLIVKSDGEPAI